MLTVPSSGIMPGLVASPHHHHLTLLALHATVVSTVGQLPYNAAVMLGVAVV